MVRYSPPAPHIWVVGRRSRGGLLRMRKPHRVVITGLGVVAPNGIGKEAFWDALVAGKSGIDYITAFNPRSYPCHVAGEVKGFTPTDFMSARTAKHAGRFAHLAVAAARLAVDD